MKDRYNPQKIEKKWQNFWEKKKLNKNKDFSEKPKYYVLDMFPYPSGAGLHVGHFKGYTATDIISRIKRMQGFEVLHPMGWDAFGLPAENYAIKTGISPEISTENNIGKIKKQMQMAGFSYDWSREINTTDPEYYRWTQWIFLKLFQEGLAFKSLAPINWCPSCKTGLANEEVLAGECERCGSQVGRKEISQWSLKITEYADRLLEGLRDIDWPEEIKEMQRNWIGRSEGWEIDFQVKGESLKIPVFTTRADTLFGATYIVLSPEHRIIGGLKDKIRNYGQVKEYQALSSKKSDIERISEQKEKSGIKIEGLEVLNPVNFRVLPVFVADYVLSSYGTGAIMAVPAHDQRDFDFSRKYGLESIEVIKAEKRQSASEAFEGEGVLVNSGRFDGTASEKARDEIGRWLQGESLAQKKINYKLRDWLFSRQRYWGEPIPLVFCQSCSERIKKGQIKKDEFSKGEMQNPGWMALSEKELPLKLPKVEKYQPTGTGESPLAGMESWVKTRCPKCAGPARRETNTMPQWAGSCWYYLRFLDPKNSKEFAAPKKEKRWMPVDWYVGGAEHAVLHLLYARFWHKFLFDQGLVSQKEPFYKLRNVGLVIAPDGQKMSKSKGNVIAPDEIIENFGADTLRIYEMFMGPFDQAIVWSPQGVKGVHRFLARFWDFVVSCPDGSKSSLRSEKEIARLNKKIEEDAEKMKFNTAISAFMEFLNFAAANSSEVGREVIEKSLVLISPFAPHLAEELWSISGHKDSVHLQPWPSYEKDLLKEIKAVLVVQVNGKVRGKLEADISASEKEALELATSQDNVIRWLEGKKIKKVVYLAGKLINIVV